MWGFSPERHQFGWPSCSCGCDGSPTLWTSGRPPLHAGMPRSLSKEIHCPLSSVAAHKMHLQLNHSFGDGKTVITLNNMHLSRFFFFFSVLGLPCGSWASHCSGFSCHRAQALGRSCLVVSRHVGSSQTGDRMHVHQTQAEDS